MIVKVLNKGTSLGYDICRDIYVLLTDAKIMAKIILEYIKEHKERKMVRQRVD